MTMSVVSTWTTPTVAEAAGSYAVEYIISTAHSQKTKFGRMSTSSSSIVKKSVGKGRRDWKRRNGCRSCQTEGRGALSTWNVCWLTCCAEHLRAQWAVAYSGFLLRCFVCHTNCSLYGPRTCTKDITDIHSYRERSLFISCV